MSHTSYGYSDYFGSLHTISEQMLSFLDREIENWVGLQVYDVACGRGEVAYSLENRGARVIAMESDSTVLSQAIERSASSPNVRTTRFFMGTLNFLKGQNDSFHMILCLNNAIAALTSEAEFFSFLQQAANLLMSNGRLIIQLMNYDRILSQKDFDLPDISVPTSGIRVKRHFVPEGADRLILNSRVEIFRSDGFEISQTKSLIYPIRKLKLTQMLKDCGYRSVSFYSAPDGSTWTEDSRRTLFVAIKS